MQRFAGVAFDGEIRCEAIRHLAVSLGRGKCVIFQQRGGASAVADLHVAQRERGHSDAQRLVVANHAFEDPDCLLEIAHAHLLIAGRRTQQRMARLECEALLQLITGQFNLVLIVVDTRTVVVKDRGIGRV